MSMTVRMDPQQAKALLDLQLPPEGMFDLTNLAAARKADEAHVEQQRATQPDDPSVTIEDIPIEREDGPPISIRLFRPPSRDRAMPALLWMHGGGQVLGFAASEDPFLKRVARNTDMIVGSVEYRLAPEHPSPAGIEDCYDAYAWLTGDAERLGIDPQRIGIGGGSAGGGLAACLALMVRDRGGPRPLYQSLSYPMLDDRNTTRSSRELPDFGIWDRETNILAWRAVLGDKAGGADVSPYAAAARATDLAGLPTAFIAVGDLDLFRDEALDYGVRLIAADVPTELHVYQGGMHGFDRLAPDSDMTNGFFETWFAFLRRQNAT